jgi:hypothetical protein
MTRGVTKVWWLVLAAYPACGLALGLADPVLGQAAAQLGTRPGVATAVSVNLILPLVALAVGFLHARVGAAWLGAALLTGGFVAGLAVQYSGGIRGWSLAGLLSSIPPVLVVGGVGYAVLGTVAALVGRTLRGPVDPEPTPRDA